MSNKPQSLHVQSYVDILTGKTVTYLIGKVGRKNVDIAKFVEGGIDPYGKCNFNMHNFVKDLAETYNQAKKAKTRG